MLDDISNFRWLETRIYRSNHSASSNDSMEGICMLNDLQKGTVISEEIEYPL